MGLRKLDRLSTLAGIAICFVFVLSTRAQDPLPPEQATLIRRLIEQLADDRYVVREAAHRQLLDLAEIARESLEEALLSPDYERASRARQILQRLPEPTHRVVDALGQPIALARVTVHVSRATNGPDNTSPRKTFADRLGRIGIPEAVANDGASVNIELQHPEYGIVRCSLSTPLPPKAGLIDCKFPLVRAGTEARQRAVRGQVVDADGKPLAGAVIRCQNVRTSGEGLINPEHPLGEVAADENGKFAFYLPPDNSHGRGRERGELIPPESRYNLLVTAADRDDCFPVEGMFSNREPVQIRLPRAAEFHRFRFVKLGGGEIGGPSEMHNVWVTYQGPDDVRVRLSNNDVVRGRKLIHGKYMATHHTSDGRAVQFLPVTVNESSPETLTFELPRSVTYRGRVIHGVTEKPVPRAWVAGWRSTARNNLALLTPDDWKTLRDMPDVAGPADAAVKLLSKFYGVEVLVRADEEGRFAIDERPDIKFYAIMAFAEDFVPLQASTSALKAGAGGLADAGDLPLFPAAKLTVRPVFAEGVRASVAPEWKLEEEGQPEWIGRLRAAADGSRRDFCYVNWLALNESQPVLVPSGVRLRVRFHTPYEDQWCSTTTGVLVAEQGESLDGGDLTFSPSLAVDVRILDQGGKPIEGVPVRRYYDEERAWSIAHNTDADGRAHFFVHRNSSGRFRALELPPREYENAAKNLLTPFRVTESPPGEPLEIILSELQLGLFRGKKP